MHPGLSGNHPQEVTCVTSKANSANAAAPGQLSPVNPVDSPYFLVGAGDGGGGTFEAP
jgi:hypothetical protein